MAAVNRMDHEVDIILQHKPDIFPNKIIIVFLSAVLQVHITVLLAYLVELY